MKAKTMKESIVYANEFRFLSVMDQIWQPSFFETKFSVCDCSRTTICGPLLYTTLVYI